MIHGTLYQVNRSFLVFYEQKPKILSNHTNDEELHSKQHAYHYYNCCIAGYGKAENFHHDTVETDGNTKTGNNSAESRAQLQWNCRKRTYGMHGEFPEFPERIFTGAGGSSGSDIRQGCFFEADDLNETAQETRSFPEFVFQQVCNPS